MKVAKTSAAAALLLGIIAAALIRGAAAGTNLGSCPDTTIFVANDDNVTAYPACGRGDVTPIALTTDMVDPRGIARDASGRIYISNSDSNTVTVYAATANGNVPPIAVIGGSNTRLANPIGIALDTSGKIYVLNSAEYPKGNITVYAPLGIGTGILNEAPIATIAGPKTMLDDSAGIALDAHGEIYIANQLGGHAVRGQRSDRGMITIYAAGSDGNVAPIVTISGAATGLSFPIGIALDANGNIYVANSETANTKSYLPSVTVYAAGSTGNAPPIAIIAGANTGLSYPQGLAVDSSGNLYAEGYVSGVGYSVNVYAAGSDGNVSPIARIAGADTGLTGFTGIVVDSSGHLYVSNENGGPTGHGSITVYPTGSSGDTAPIATITSNFTGLDYASGLALDSAGNIHVTNEFGSAGQTGSVAIYPAGSYAIGPPAATIAGDQTGLYYPYGIALDSSGNISVLNGDNAITEYPAGSAGNVTPNATITIDSSGNTNPTGIAMGASGKLYVANQGNVSCNRQSCRQTGAANVSVYSAGSDGNAKPSDVLRGLSTGLASPSAIAVDHHGDIYVTNEGPMECRPSCGCVPTGSGSVTVYAPGSKGDVSPIATISGAKTKLRIPYGIALDSNRNIYVLNATGFFLACVGFTGPAAATKDLANSNVAAATAYGLRGPILIFAAGSSGDTVPIGAIGGPFTGLDFYPEGIAVGPAGP
ncbi:MAG: NHL repeat-containing protein [Candidatus Binataceae bacterium]|jgi:sugar lactone lactonase YvrE